MTASNEDGGASAQAGASNVAGAPTQNGGAPAQGGAAPQAGAPTQGGAPPQTACPNPVYDSAKKLITCSNGRAHRKDVAVCTFTTPPPAAGGASGAGGGDGTTICQSNADCSALPYGYCSGDGGFSLSTCHPGCTSDSECGTGMICACDGVTPGRCTNAGCTIDADCGANSLCAPVSTTCGPNAFQCTTNLDECISNEDCMYGSCVVQDGHRKCDNAVCGRPFLVADAPRVAEIETRGDWLDATLSPDVRALSPIQRAQLAAHWARLGQLEHASIAAFARFNLQLLSLGAPSDLIDACNRALSDETAHARMCFALASAYGAAPVGPARLDIERCFEETSLTAIAKLVLREGCLGETVASLEAVAAAEVATDPAVVQALARIARDELCHAELAFKFLRWALTQSSPEARHELACEAAQQLADFESDARHGERTRTDDRLAMHGLLGSDALRAIHLAAARDVARPLLAALFDIEVSGAA